MFDLLSEGVFFKEMRAEWLNLQGLRKRTRLKSPVYGIAEGLPVIQRYITA